MNIRETRFFSFQEGYRCFHKITLAPPNVFGITINENRVNILNGYYHIVGVGLFPYSLFQRVTCLALLILSYMLIDYFLSSTSRLIVPIRSFFILCFFLLINGKRNYFIAIPKRIPLAILKSEQKVIILPFSKFFCESQSKLVRVNIFGEKFFLLKRENNLWDAAKNILEVSIPSFEMGNLNLTTLFEFIDEDEKKIVCEYFFTKNAEGSYPILGQPLYQKEFWETVVSLNLKIPQEVFSTLSKFNHPLCQQDLYREDSIFYMLKAFECQSFKMKSDSPLGAQIIKDYSYRQDIIDLFK